MRACAAQALHDPPRGAVLCAVRCAVLCAVLRVDAALSEPLRLLSRANSPSQTTTPHARAHLPSQNLIDKLLAYHAYTRREEVVALGAAAARR